MRAILLISLLTLTIGCQREQQVDDWTEHSLSAAQKKRQTELIEKFAPTIHAEALDGKPVTEIEELLTLPDKTQQRGNQTLYSYSVLTTGDVQIPGELIIIVENETILQARWPYSGEY